MKGPTRPIIPFPRSRPSSHRPTSRYFWDVPKSRVIRDSTEQKSPVLMVRDAADAMFRAAAECCHQHGRASRIHAKASLEAEVETAQRACEECDEALRERVEFYESTAGDVVPGGDDEPWWHCANALWLASREYRRRHGGCDSSTRDLKNHSPERLHALHAEYELEASALLALRHAADAYKRLRPSAA